MSIVNAPAVSCVMAAFNAADSVERSVRSILQQSFSNFEIIVVDDGSTDQTLAILEDLAGEDTRLRVIRNASNQGLTKSLNRALDLARGEYIARMDADDMAAVHRFERQIEFLREHAEVGLLGSEMELCAEGGTVIGLHGMPRNSGVMAFWLMTGHNPIAHPTVMARRQVLQDLGGYDPDYRYAQDYELWSRAAHVTRMANLPEPLLRFNYGQNRISTARAEQQIAQGLAALAKASERLLGARLDPILARALLTFSGLGSQPLPLPFDTVMQHVLAILAAMEDQGMIAKSDRPLVHEYVAQRAAIQRDPQLPAEAAAASSTSPSTSPSSLNRYLGRVVSRLTGKA